MARQKSLDVNSRNVKLTIKTYDRLEKYLVGLISEKGVRKLTMNDAVATLLEEYYQKAEKKGKI